MESVILILGGTRLCKAVLVGIWLFWVSWELYRLVRCGTGSVLDCTGWYLVVLGSPVRQSWLVYSANGSIQDGIGWYLGLLGQCRAVLVGTWLYWVRTGRYWLPM